MLSNWGNLLSVGEQVAANIFVSSSSEHYRVTASEISGSFFSEIPKFEPTEPALVP